jgi:hypothetical protein
MKITRGPKQISDILDLWRNAKDVEIDVISADSRIWQRRSRISLLQ